MVYSYVALQHLDWSKLFGDDRDTSNFRGGPWYNTSRQTFSVPSSFLNFLISNMFVVVGQVPSPLVYDWAPPPLLPGADHPHGALLSLLLPQEVSGVRESGCTWVDIGEGEHIVAGT